MTYNYFFEISAILITVMILFDYRNKRIYLKRETRLFKIVTIVVAAECTTNLLSSMMIHHTESIPVVWNLLVATLFFVLQATMLFAIVVFSFVYMNSHLKWKSLELYIVTGMYLLNLGLSVTSPFTGFYFYFDEGKKYVQGYGSAVGFWFYIINILLCLAYVLYNKKHLLLKDMRVAVIVAALVGIGFIIQFAFRSLLMLDFSIALAVLYMYMTLENPNDSIDKLTLCGNGYVFRKLIDEKIEEKKVFSVLYMDIRKFRFVNYNYGIVCGDALLKKIASFLEQVFPSQQVFRIYDDLFAVIVDLPQESMHSYIQDIIERFELDREIQENVRICLNMMITVCEFPKCFQSNTELNKLRNNMLQYQKEMPDKKVLFSEESMYEECIRREHVEQILRNALQNNGLEVFYQPIINSSTDTVVSLEALARLHDEILGYIPPDEFISIAEKTGLIIELGFIVLEKVCQYIHEHLLSNPWNTINCVHVNISTLQCEYPHLYSRMMQMLDQYEVPPQMIQLELTESTMLYSPELLLKTMKTLYEKGIRFALDDYGTGYSNISYLIQFPFHEVKFDKTIVQSCFSNPEAELIIRNEFEILKQLHKPVVVEGIETEEQYAKMREYGIELFQGYYFSKPLPEEESIRYKR